MNMTALLLHSTPGAPTAARRFREYAKKHGDRLGALDGWLGLFWKHGIYASPLNNYPACYTARLFYSEENALWLIGYNGRAAPGETARFLCHEFVEYLAVTDHLSLFDDLPGIRPESSAAGTLYCYDGGVDPGAIHHRIARRIEELCFRRI